MLQGARPEEPCHGGSDKPRGVLYKSGFPQPCSRRRPAMIARRVAIAAVLLSVVSVSLRTASADSNWPRWRGPQQDGHSTETGFPKKWDKSSVVWKKALPGDGQSVPIIWGDRIFMTTALDRGAERIVLCVERKTGEIVWQKSVWKGTPEPSHTMNGWASSSCVTDGEHVWAFFGKGGGLFCFTVDGEQVWNKPLGEFPGPWGTAASPILVGELLIQNCDSDGEGFLLAVEKATGKTVWKVDREQQRGWSSPILVDAGGRKELVIQGHTGIRGYDPASGEEFWRLSGTNGRGTPTVTPADGLIYFVPGRGPAAYAVKPGGSGDISKTHVAWTQPRKGRDLPSPIIIGKFVLIMSMKGGILSCYDSKTGELHWNERIGGTYTASPVAYEGVAAFVSDEGPGLVVEPGTEPKVTLCEGLGSDLEEIFRSSITPSGGQLFIRSTKVLYCVGK